MRIHYLQHVEFEDLASIEKWANDNNYEISCTRLFNDESLPDSSEYDFLIIMGGSMNIYEHKEFPWIVKEKVFIENAIKKKKKVLGICLGAQILADTLGGNVYRNKYKEIGWFNVKLSSDALKQKKSIGLPEEFMAFHWHGDTFSIPSGCTLCA